MKYEEFLEENFMSTLTVNNVSNMEYASASSNVRKTENGSRNAFGTAPLGANDAVETKSNNGMPKLTPIIYEIKDGDTLMKIANELGLSITDVVQQLKDSGKLPKDYDVNARHAKDISWMKKGNKIKLSYPATKQQKADYDAYCEKRTKEYYNKKAAKAREEKAVAKAKARAEYDALPWYKKIFTDRP